MMGMEINVDPYREVKKFVGLLKIIALFHFYGAPQGTN